MRGGECNKVVYICQVAHVVSVLCLLKAQVNTVLNHILLLSCNLQPILIEACFLKVTTIQCHVGGEGNNGKIIQVGTLCRRLHVLLKKNKQTQLTVRTGVYLFAMHS